MEKLKSNLKNPGPRFEKLIRTKEPEEENCKNCSLKNIQSRRTVFCEECKSDYCQECDQNIHSIKVFEQHKRVQYSEGNFELIVARSRLCDAHQLNKEFFCQNCDEFLCKNCLAQHKTHSTKSLEEALLQWKVNNKLRLYEDAEELESEIREGVEHLTENMQKHEDQKVNGLQKINILCEEFILVMEEEIRKFLVKVVETLPEREKMLKKQLKNKSELLSAVELFRKIQQTKVAHSPSNEPDFFSEFFLCRKVKDMLLPEENQTLNKKLKRAYTFVLFDNINEQLEELTNNIKEKTVDFQENVVERVVWKNGNAKLIRERKDQFSKLSKEKQRAVLGELLFPLVSKELESRSKASLAPKVTGILIDLDMFSVKDVLQTIENNQLLVDRVSDALNILLA